jgi:aspartate/methionine/tyrosine aminotransferase
MAVGLALAANTQNSALTSIFVTHLLTSPELPSLISLNSTRLKEAYESLTAVLQRHKVPYIPCYAGIYVFAKIAPNASQWEDEAAKIAKMKVAGVVMSSGRAYHGPDGEKGWARISFALDPEVMKEAVRRIESVLGDENNAVS